MGQTQTKQVVPFFQKWSCAEPLRQTGGPWTDIQDQLIVRKWILQQWRQLYTEVEIFFRTCQLLGCIEQHGDHLLSLPPLAINEEDNAFYYHIVIAAVCLYIAGKYECYDETNLPWSRDLIHNMPFLPETFTTVDFIALERTILKLVNYSLNGPTVHDYACLVIHVLNLPYEKTNTLWTLCFCLTLLKHSSWSESQTFMVAFLIWQKKGSAIHHLCQQNMAGTFTHIHSIQDIPDPYTTSYNARANWIDRALDAVPDNAVPYIISILEMYSQTCIHALDYISLDPVALCRVLAQMNKKQ